jgi:hypothetical protein
MILLRGCPVRHVADPGAGREILTSRPRWDAAVLLYVRRSSCGVLSSLSIAVRSRASGACQGAGAKTRQANSCSQRGRPAEACKVSRRHTPLGCPSALASGFGNIQPWHGVDLANTKSHSWAWLFRLIKQYLSAVPPFLRTQLSWHIPSRICFLVDLNNDGRREVETGCRASKSDGRMRRNRQ